MKLLLCKIKIVFAVIYRSGNEKWVFNARGKASEGFEFLAKENFVLKKSLDHKPEPKKCGRSRLTWICVIKKDLIINNLDPLMIQSRCLWRRQIR